MPIAELETWSHWWEASTLTNVPRSSLHVTVSYGYVSEETLALHVGEVTGQVIQKSSLEKLQPALFACFASYLIHSNASVVYCWVLGISNQNSALSWCKRCCIAANLVPATLKSCIKVTQLSYFVRVPSLLFCEGIPTFTLILSLTYSMDNILINLQHSIKFMSQFSMTMKFRIRVVSQSIVALKKFDGKKIRIFKEMLFSWEGLTNDNK